LGKNGEKEAIKQSWWFFRVFEIELLVSGLDLPVNIASVPEPDKKPDSPLLYITELMGG